MDYKELCLKVTEIAKSAGKIIKEAIDKNYKIKIDKKGKHNFVTEIDKKSEKFIIDNLIKLLPESGFIAEENTVEFQKKNYLWIIDPLDGTTNFIHGAPPVAVSIALLEKDEIVLGVIYEIFMNECFYAWKNSEAFLNDTPIKVSQTSELNNFLIATGFPYQNFDRITPFMRSLEYFFNNTHGVRRLGSAATDLAYVACGRYDAFYEYNLSPWDVAAGSFIVQQAGGKVSDFKGGKNYLFGKEIIATNYNGFQEFLNAVAKFMNN